MIILKDNDTVQGTEKEFMDLFEDLTGSLNDWQVWSDLMAMMACSLSNAFDCNEKRIKDREKEYSESEKRLGGNEIPAKIFVVVTQALERNPDQDFLGKMYMNLGLGSHWKGQFFTPFNLSQLMAEIDFQKDKVDQEIKKHGWASVNDPSCGAGSTLIAAASSLRRQKINYQQSVAFIGNDIDRVTAQMCYIQLALLGCPGYVVVTDTLVNPVTGPVIQPDEKETQEFWYTPMWWSDIWTGRRFMHHIFHNRHTEERTAEP
ncbi:MAG: N-6 DNA methylase [Lachnospiraceae bacterium]|nr:N-6 DNA methylase [Lachnospiraceae bacterium]